MLYGGLVNAQHFTTLGCDANVGHKTHFPQVVPPDLNVMENATFGSWGGNQLRTTGFHSSQVVKTLEQKEKSTKTCNVWKHLVG